MRKTLTVAAVVVAILSPGGTAFAGSIEQGNAYGNCKNNAAGTKTLMDGHAGEQGLGGFAKLDRETCKPVGGGDGSWAQ